MKYQHSLNGGLYTGEKFQGSWGNIPIVPDTITYINSLPVGSPGLNHTMYPGGGHRPGNNTSLNNQIEIGVPDYDYTMSCVLNKKHTESNIFDYKVDNTASYFNTKPSRY